MFNASFLRKTGISIYLLTILNFCIAQPNKQKINNAINYVSRKLTIFYLEEYVKKNAVERANFIELKKDIGNDSISVQFDSVTFSKLLSSHNFTKTSQKITSKIYSIRFKISDNTNQIAEEILSSAIQVYENPKIPKISASFKDSLKHDLDGYFRNDKKETVVSQSSPHVYTQNTNPFETENSSNSESTLIHNFPLALSAFLLGMLVGGSIVYLLKAKQLKRLHEDLDDLEDSIKTKKRQITELQTASDMLKSKNSENQLKKDKGNQELQNQPMDIQKANVQNSSRIDTEEFQIKAEQNVLESNDNKVLKQTEFYVSVPYDDGSFSERNRSSEYIEQVHNYKLITTNSEQNMAKLRFLNTVSSITKAIESPHTYIYPVLEETHLRPQKFKAIKIIENGDGLWELMNDKWVMKTKAKIKYE